MNGKNIYETKIIRDIKKKTKAKKNHFTRVSHLMFFFQKVATVAQKKDILSFFSPRYFWFSSLVQ